MPKICLISTGQPSTNPRLVKEADALSEEGYEVTALCSYWSDWAYEFDKEILKNAKWACRYIGGVPPSIKYSYSRFRFRLVREAYIRNIKFLREKALSRTTPDLISAARKFKADLYIGHNLGALPAVVEAARFNKGKAGFDAEDFHSGMGFENDVYSVDNKLAEDFEGMYLNKCDYITTASYRISQEYSKKYKLDTPETILNVFPLSLRPPKFREHQKNQPLKLFWFSQTIGQGRGLEDIVEALGVLNKPDIEFHLLGNCSDEYKKSLLELCKNNNLSPIKLIFHSPIEPNEIIKFASNFDIGLALEPGRDFNNSIALSNKIFTYFLAGNAIIATNTKGQEDITKVASNTIKSYKPHDIKTLVTIIGYWYENRNELEEARKSSWEYGTSKYNWDLEKKKFLDCIERALI